MMMGRRLMGAQASGAGNVPQIINGDFATGDFTGWNASSGSYHAMYEFYALRWLGANIPGGEYIKYSELLDMTFATKLRWRQATRFPPVPGLLFVTLYAEHSGESKIGVFSSSIDGMVSDLVDWDLFELDLSDVIGPHLIEIVNMASYKSVEIITNIELI